MDHRQMSTQAIQLLHFADNSYTLRNYLLNSASRANDVVNF